jgi:hypothetical protein
MLLPNASTSTLDLATEEGTTTNNTHLDASASTTTLDDSIMDTTPSGSIRSSTGILSASVPGNVFPQLNTAPIPAFFSTSQRAITVRPNSWHLRATGLSSNAIRHSSDQCCLQSNNSNTNHRDRHHRGISTNTFINNETDIPSSSTLWQAWKQQERANKSRKHRHNKKRSMSSSSSSESDSNSSSSQHSQLSQHTINTELVKQTADYSMKGWFVWFIRLGLVHICLPFINGVMLGFGEICANEVTIRTGWLGLRALTDNYLHQ